MKYFYRKIYVINGEILEDPRVEIYRVNSKGVIHVCSSCWGEMIWIKSWHRLESLEKKYTLCSLKQVKELFNDYLTY